MIEFKKNIQQYLPYDRAHYIEYLDDWFEGTTQWNGLSFQLDIDRIGVAKALEIFKPFFKNIVSELDTNEPWIINYDDFDVIWLSQEENNLPSLRALFKENKIRSNWKGAIVLMKDDLFKLLDDLLVYPYGPHGVGVTRWKNLDVSHSKFPFILKITDHLDINLLSIDKVLLKKFGDEYRLESFEIKQYRGTSLW